ncbi:hypothetical protein J3E72DRAFT_383839 [Bipolaris maydis]|nr:hypothetical protein BM1_05959 [Bipolaris maydis]KAJ5063374.1 hypothetical protein J3E74DRAFT_415984 [Bipolaris maydis]KAJ6199638.1 hypothetical protein J3E72DRAFT_383839 [Bipolaris maydis]KAJ6205761.1 hypothetical protein PSV09DRAFT_2436613 [Bipolaris maydis]KAJ6272765.1 hypothetical protein PSV08DRAFT_360615 [Bipolaris maydis]
MRLYTFGSSSSSSSSTLHGSPEEDDTIVPTSTAVVAVAGSIRILWASWCDVLLAYCNVDNSSSSREEQQQTWHLRYHGTGLSQSQQDYLHAASTADGRLAKAVGEKEGHTAVFFGSTMHHGLQGYIVTFGGEESGDGGQEIVLFTTPTEEEDDDDDDSIQSSSSSNAESHDVHRYLIPQRSGETETLTMHDIAIQSDETLLLSLKSGIANKAGWYVASVQDMAQLRVWLGSGAFAAASASASGVQVKRAWYDSQSGPQVVSNATTTTVLGCSGGAVWTSSSGARYQACVGRPFCLDGASEFRAIPYLEQTCVKRVASGGYLSAALSAEGELFVWGQACPGSTGEMDVLNGNAEGHATPSTGITVAAEEEEDADEFVKCLEVRINGNEASVYQVAIGHGHILVAAESANASPAKERVVFGAGDNSMGQLGLEARRFYSAFHEVQSLRGKRVAQLYAAGWSSFVVTLEE